jgi:protein TonB
MEIDQAGICLINALMDKRQILFLLFLIPFTYLKAQDENKVFEKVEINAHTNQKQWIEHISKKTQLPDSVLRDIPPGTYKINVQFIVDIHGSLGQVKAKNDPGYGLAQRAINIISTYKGKWEPANQCGRNVKAYREEVLIFIIPYQ